MDPLIRLASLCESKGVLIMGPTSVGKTSFAVKLSSILNAEVISLDSVQVYRGLDIGSDKVSIENQAKVVHHMIDVCDVSHLYNASEYLVDCRKALESILLNRRVPLFVGGSCFYAEVLLRGLPERFIKSDVAVRNRLNSEVDEFGVERLYDKLMELDGQYASTITKRDRNKIVRALEIIELTGNPVSSHSWNISEKFNSFPLFPIWLDRNVGAIKDSINERCKKMFSSGLVEEVSNLCKIGLKENSSASKAIGYREVLQFIDGVLSKEECEKSLVQSSLKLAKKQLKWLKRKKSFFRLEVSSQNVSDMFCKLDSFLRS